MKKQRESILKSAIMEYLVTISGLFAWKVHTTGIPNGKGGFRKNFSTGVSDILGVYNGVPFALEANIDDGKATENQTAFLKKFDEAGGYSAIVRSVDDVQECMEEIREMGWRK